MYKFVCFPVQASPGNLCQFEDLLYNGNESTASSGLAAIKLEMEGSQLVSSAD